jgi:hypothetical protein
MLKYVKIGLICGQSSGIIHHAREDILVLQGRHRTATSYLWPSDSTWSVISTMKSLVSVSRRSLTRACRHEEDEWRAADNIPRSHVNSCIPSNPNQNDGINSYELALLSRTISTNDGCIGAH